MTGQAECPLLFLDVDGPLLPFGEDPQRAKPHATPGSRLTRLSPQPGLRLAALPCELVWATTWEDDANAEIAPRLGLPALPVVIWPESSGHEREDRWLGLCWKTRALVGWARGRPFAWVDDEITDADRDWVPANHDGRALLYSVEPSADSPARTSQPSTGGSGQRETRLIRRPLPRATRTRSAACAVNQSTTPFRATYGGRD